MAKGENVQERTRSVTIRHFKLPNFHFIDISCHTITNDHNAPFTSRQYYILMQRYSTAKEI